MKQRIYKYRAWDKEGKRMIFVNQITFGEPENLIMGNVNNEFKVISGTNFDLMQYTGLKDKEETWESDIVKFKDGRIGVIEVSDRLTAYIRDQDDGFYNLDTILDREYKIIGNIYQHSNLLK